MRHPHVSQHRLRSHTDFIFDVCSLGCAKIAAFLKCLWQSSHGIRTSSNAHGGLNMQSPHVRAQGVLDVAFTHLAASFIHLLFRHGISKVRYDVIMSFDLVVKYIESFRGVYPSFEHYVFTGQTAVDNYLILPKCSRNLTNSGIPAPFDRSIPVVSSRVWTT